MRIGNAARADCGILAVRACGFGVVRAQKKVHVGRPIIEPRAEDVDTIEGIVKASYETLSGGVGVLRQWGRDRTLFDPKSRSVAVGGNPCGATVKIFSSPTSPASRGRLSVLPRAISTILGASSARGT